MNTKDLFFADVEREVKVTREVLSALPEDKYAYRPHAKSMTLGGLAMHVAYLPGWMQNTIEHDVLDFATAPRPPKLPASRADLLQRFDDNVAGLRNAIAAFDVARLDGNWNMAQGSHVFVSRPRVFVYRVWSMNHLVHHRGQLCLYLRLLDVPVPTIYFNTADDPEMKFE